MLSQSRSTSDSQSSNVTAETPRLRFAPLAWHRRATLETMLALPRGTRVISATFHHNGDQDAPSQDMLAQAFPNLHFERVRVIPNVELLELPEFFGDVEVELAQASVFDIDAGLWDIADNREQFEA